MAAVVNRTVKMIKSTVTVAAAVAAEAVAVLSLITAVNVNLDVQQHHAKMANI